MSEDKFEAFLRQLVASNPDVIVKRTITVDPLVMDGLKTELALLSKAKFMENNEWDSEQVEELIIEAYNAANKFVRISKANEALRVSPQCAHAYLILAMEEHDLQHKIGLLNEGIAAAQATMQSELFLEFADCLWQRPDARPYMRCKTALALALWESGDHAQAIDIMKDLLRINREDGQGLRYRLASWLLEFNPDDEYIHRPFFKDYKADTSAFIQYSYALWLFQKQGPVRASTNALLRAIKHNKYVPVFLLKKGQMPLEKLHRVERGSPEEAVSYCRIAASCWDKFPDSIDWLNANVGSMSKIVIKEAETAKQCDVELVPFAGMPLNI